MVFFSFAFIADDSPPLLFWRNQGGSPLKPPRERKVFYNLYLFIYMCVTTRERERNDEGEIKRMARIKGRH
jgi:hypothetical protein